MSNLQPSSLPSSLPMFTSVLIANRGEIACRIARTAKRLGMRTIAVYSTADAGALHVRHCDEAYLIGGAEPRAELSRHRAPDRGREEGECRSASIPATAFLSENAEFAEACAKAGIVFVGPPPAAIRAMGLKDHAKALMEKARVPVVPGYHGERQDAKFLKEKAYEIGYPVLIKPAAGGGGRGMRRVDKHADFDAALEGAVREAQSSFGSGRVLIEKYIASPRHIEVQVFADTSRQLDLSRRTRLLAAAAPSEGDRGSAGARHDARSCAPRSAPLRSRRRRRSAMPAPAPSNSSPTASKGLRADGFWFIEMNTRLQVEHPVTEAVTGLDLVEWQFRVAANEKLAADAGRGAARRPRRRSAALCRGSRARLSAVDRQDRGAGISERHPRRFRRRGGRRGVAVLRRDDRKAHRACADARSRRSTARGRARAYADRGPAQQSGVSRQAVRCGRIPRRAKSIPA